MLPILLTLLALPAHYHRFFSQLFPLWQAIPGRVNVRNFSRYGGWNERTLRRWFQKTLPWKELHWGLLQLLLGLGVLDHRFLLALDASFIPKSGHKTAGVGAFWNGASHRSETGLELSCLALLSWSGHHAFPVHVRQTQPRRDKADRLEQVPGSTGVLPWATSRLAHPASPGGGRGWSVCQNDVHGRHWSRRLRLRDQTAMPICSTRSPESTRNAREDGKSGPGRSTS